MPQTVEETIDADVIQSLGTVTPLAEYANTFQVEEPQQTEGNVSKDGLCIVGSGEIEVADAPINQDRYVKNYNIEVHVTESEASSEKIRARLDGAWADVVKALTRTRSSYTRGGRAFWTKVSLPTREHTTGANSGKVRVTVQVYFATAIGDPFTNPYMP